jgi:hypothetical protein
VLLQAGAWRAVLQVPLQVQVQVQAPHSAAPRAAGKGSTRKLGCHQ